MNSIEYFTANELQCKCGCGKQFDNQKFIEKLTSARIIAGIEFKITSGVRCYDHNKAIGGAKASEHMSSNAVDIEAKTSFVRYRIVESLLRAGFNRIGIDENFVHVDDSKIKSSNCIFLY